MASVPAREPLIKIVGVSKSFGSLWALRGVSLEIYPGEILGLLGENGAGKTTLMNILFGLYRPDSGEIYVEGRKKIFRRPSEAINSGIFMVHQHFKLVKDYTALENIALGSGRVGRSLGGGWRKVSRGLIENLMGRYGIHVNLDSRASTLSLGEQQKIEILKALFRGAKLLILDEPTTNLGPQEVESLKKILTSLRNSGVSVVIVSHKLRDVIDISNRIAVLRRGKIVGVFERGSYDEKTLLEAMFGDAASISHGSRHAIPERVGSGMGSVLELKGLACDPGDAGVFVDNVELKLYRGEILGVAGVAGNGQKELAECIVGLRGILRGSVIVDGEDVSSKGPADRMKRGLLYIPEDRLGEGVLPSMSVAENMVLGIHRMAAKGFLLNPRALESSAREMIERLGIRTPSARAPAGSLSGGNIQKILIARALMARPKILVAHNPTRGLDMLTYSTVHKIFREMVLAGSAVLLISDNLDEILDVSDRVAVIYKGRLSTPLSSGPGARERVVAMMTGVQRV